MKFILFLILMENKLYLHGYNYVTKALLAYAICNRNELIHANFSDGDLMSNWRSLSPLPPLVKRMTDFPSLQIISIPFKHITPFPRLEDDAADDDSK